MGGSLCVLHSVMGHLDSDLTRTASCEVLKDKHSQGIAQNTAEYESWKADTDKLVPVRLLNVPVQGAMPLHEVLQAGVVVLSYYKLAADRSAARFEELSKRFRDEVGCPEFRGGALISPTGLGGDAVSFGAWDSVEVRLLCPMCVCVTHNVHLGMSTVRSRRAIRRVAGRDERSV